MDRRALIALAATILGASHPSLADTTSTNDTRCIVGQHCEVQGRLSLPPFSPHSSAAVVWDREGRCIPVLLPNGVLRDRRWDEKSVTVQGDALQRFKTPPEVAEMQYRDRWLPMVVCSGSPFVLYEESIRRGA
jgi:hypothetical protein